MIKITDHNFFTEVVADAVAQAHLTCRRKSVRNRWINAIAKAAAVILEDHNDFIHWEPEQEILHFWSTDSDEIYQVSEVCRCPAYLQPVPQPCYHRAMCRLVKNYFELQRKPGEIIKVDFADAVFFDPNLSAREKVEMLNLSILEGRSELQPRACALQKLIPS